MVHVKCSSTDFLVVPHSYLCSSFCKRFHFMKGKGCFEFLKLSLAKGPYLLDIYIDVKIFLSFLIMKQFIEWLRHLEMRKI